MTDYVTAIAGRILVVEKKREKILLQKKNRIQDKCTVGGYAATGYIGLQERQDKQPSRI